MFRLRTMLRSAAVACWLLSLLCDGFPDVDANAPAQAQVMFDMKANGGSAAALGASRLRAIRKNSGMEHRSIEGLAKQLDEEDDLGVDLTHDRLVYSCASLKRTPAAQAEGAAAVQELADADRDAAGPADLAGHHHHHHRHLLQATDEWGADFLPEEADKAWDSKVVFGLHSRPSATKKIYLDFNGHVTTGTVFNTWPQANGGDIVTPPFHSPNQDLDPNTFGPSERADIFGIWRVVAEDWSPFDVDVTLEEPNQTVPLSNWVRVVIGGRDWTSQNGVGLAYFNGGFSPTDGHYYNPAFIFFDDLDNSARRTADAISHEVGHLLGLSHDGQSLRGVAAETYGGNPTDTLYDWAPIMGNTFSNLFAQWSKGEYNGATRKEDDCQIISQKLPYVQQMHGSSTATATPLGGVMSPDNTTATANVTGVIRMPSDSEFMYFRVSRPGTATLRVLVQPQWPQSSMGRSNLNLALTVLDANGNPVPGGSQRGIGIPAYSVTLPAAGIYYTSIVGVGAGDPITTGYSSYGSRGVYQLFVTYPSDGNMDPPPPPPASPSMTITWTGSATTNKKKQVVCTITATVTDAADGNPVSAASISGGTWTATATSGFPYPVSAVATSSTGVAAFTSKAFSPSLPTGNSCTFTVSSITKTGFTLAPAAAMSHTLTW